MNLINASRNGDIYEVSHFLNEGVDINKTDEDGQTPLMVASQEGHSDIIRLLLQKGADVNIVTHSGFNALTMATIEGYTEVARLLIQAGSNVRQRDEMGASILSFACEKGNIEIVRLLLDAGADADIMLTDDEEGVTPLEIAERRGDEEIVQLLRERLWNENVNVNEELKNLSVQQCSDYTGFVGNNNNDEDVDIKTALKMDDVIILKIRNNLFCQPRNVPVTYFYGCVAPTGFIGPNNVIRDKKYVKYGPYNTLITEEDYKKTKRRKNRIVVLRPTGERLVAIVSLDARGEPRTGLGIDHCQEGSGQDLYALDAYTLEDGKHLLTKEGKNNRRNNNERKEGGRRGVGWKSRKHRKQRRGKSMKKSGKTRRHRVRRYSHILI